MFHFAFVYHLQYELSKSLLFVILPNLRETMQSLLIHVFTVEICQSVQFTTDDSVGTLHKIK